MRILLLNWRDVRHPKSGGAEFVTMEHAKGWVRAGHTVTWLTASYTGAKKESTVEGVHFVRRWGSLTIYLYAPLYILANARFFDVIVDQVHGIPFFSPLFTRKPIVVFIHEVAGEIWDFMYPFPVNYFGKFLERWYFQLYRRCLFWTVAPSAADELVSRGIPRSQCEVILSTVKANPVHLTHLPEKQKNPTFLFVSRVVRMKGIEEVIKAFSFIVRSHPEANLRIVGEGEVTYVQELKEMIKEYGVKENVTFYGAVSEREKYRLMASSHILLHASVKEGWGLVVLEAALVGTPAVVYNVRGLRDVVKNGQTGIVVSNNSPSQMASEAMTLFLDTRRYALFQKNGRTWAKSIHWSDAINKSLHLLHRAVYNG